MMQHVNNLPNVVYDDFKYIFNYMSKIKNNTIYRDLTSNPARENKSKCPLEIETSL